MTNEYLKRLKVFISCYYYEQNTIFSDYFNEICSNQHLVTWLLLTI